MGPRPQCYIPRPTVIGPLVPEKKIFERFLPHMGVAAILVMWPRCPEQTFIPLTHGGSTWNLALIGPAVLEKIFENGGRTPMDNGRTDDGACLYYKLTNEPKGSGELKTYKWAMETRGPKLSELLCLSWLPATLMMIQSKMNELAWRHHFPHYKSMGNFLDAQGQLTP